MKNKTDPEDDSTAYIHHFDSPLGGITAASDSKALTGLWFDGQKHFCVPADAERKDVPVFRQTEEWLRLYWSGRIPDFTPPLAPAGTPFQKRVWELLLKIPYGQTVTYGRIAGALALERMSAQAVGGAVGHNPISLIIPCHRVIGVDGSLTGYAGGTEKKRRLLLLEKQTCAALLRDTETDQKRKD